MFFADRNSTRRFVPMALAILSLGLGGCMSSMAKRPDTLQCNCRASKCIVDRSASQGVNSDAIVNAYEKWVASIDDYKGVKTADPWSRGEPLYPAFLYATQEFYDFIMAGGQGESLDLLVRNIMEASQHELHDEQDPGAWQRFFVLEKCFTGLFDHSEDLITEYIDIIKNYFPQEVLELEPIYDELIESYPWLIHAKYCRLFLQTYRDFLYIPYHRFNFVDQHVSWIDASDPEFHRYMCRGFSRRGFYRIDFEARLENIPTLLFREQIPWEFREEGFGSPTYATMCFSNWDEHRSEYHLYDSNRRKMNLPVQTEVDSDK